ncbi:hypothetical protein [Clostridium sp.]|uniref:hypothetical protein n=1 Tax=Clostridium sp. TaxID=1506 RepID=UPI003F349BC7
MGNKYHKKKSSNWSKVFQETFRDASETIINNFKRNCNNCVPVFFNPIARLVVYGLILITLLFSGIGFYTWIILGMLIIILQFI